MKLIILFISIVVSSNGQCNFALYECMQVLLGALFPNLSDIKPLGPVNLSDNVTSNDGVNITAYKSIIKSDNNDTNDFVFKTLIYEVKPDETNNNLTEVTAASNDNKTTHPNSFESLILNLSKSLKFSDFLGDDRNKTNNSENEISFFDYSIETNSSDYPFVDYIEFYNDLNATGLFDFDTIDLNDTKKKLDTRYEVFYLERISKKKGSSNVTFTFKGNQPKCLKLNVTFTTYADVNKTNSNAIATKLNDTSMVVQVLNTSEPVVLTIRGKQGLEFPRLQSFRIDDKDVCNVDNTKPVLALPIEGAMATLIPSFQSLIPETVSTEIKPSDIDDNTTIDDSINIEIVKDAINQTINNVTSIINNSVSNVTDMLKASTGNISEVIASVDNLSSISLPDSVNIGLTVPNITDFNTSLSDISDIIKTGVNNITGIISNATGVNITTSTADEASSN